MDNRKKNIIYTIILFVSVFAVWLYRKNSVVEPIRIEGATMGTSYHITYFDSEGRNFKRDVDSLLLVVNKSINNYDPSSEVSKFNKSEKGIAFELPYLYPPVKKAAEVFAISQGAFDPTVMPLVNVWGFGPAKQLRPDSAMIDSIKTFIGFEKIILSKDSVLKTDERVQLDFGGIGQGYGADVVTDFLKSKGITNMLVELGGEGMAIGKNLKTDKPWEIGILDPNSTQENQFFKAYIALENKSFTTSGNYFNYREVEGKKYSHTIDPVTGFPAQLAILSASVFSADCTTADAWGTSLMVMGHEKAIELLKLHPEIDALLIYTSPQGKMETYSTPGVSSLIRLEP
ncbi:MAG TPA: FAD:protein FMN transferase [Chryseolinea sp.]|nr:FAD:protein FMN transferase [Chryseolinea sp.]HPM30386.1 FAD:protein FMN transferase [Chryseolinea sp.]